MADREQVEILKQGAEIWNKWIEKYQADNSPGFIDIDLIEANLSNINLSNVNLRGLSLEKTNLIGSNLTSANLDTVGLSLAKLNNTNFTYANLRNTDLTGADLTGASFVEANLTGADLSEANLKSASLIGATLTDANLIGADLSEADLRRANLSGTNLTNSNFGKATIGFTLLGDTDLSTIRGLEEVTHHGSSIIDNNTIQRSKGKIPTVFLRGCGLSDADIEYAKLANPGLDPEQVTEITYRIHELYIKAGIQYYSCFISYSSKDHNFAQQLHDDLQNNSVRCWFAHEDMKIGDQIRPRIDQEIRLRDKLLVILSEYSVKSEWVGDEVEAALEEESKSERLVLFPIRLDTAVMNTRDDWAAKIRRRRHIGDFSNWRDKDSYQKSFDRLLRDLKATGK